MPRELRFGVSGLRRESQIGEWKAYSIVPEAVLGALGFEISNLAPQHVFIDCLHEDPVSQRHV